MTINYLGGRGNRKKNSEAPLQEKTNFISNLERLPQGKNKFISEFSSGPLQIINGLPLTTCIGCIMYSIPPPPTACRSWYKETASPVNKDIVIVFDKSNSMKGSLMNQVKKAVVAVLESLGPNDRVSLHCIDTTDAHNYSKTGQT